MSRENVSLGDAAESFHADVPITFKSWLTMSTYTRDLLAEIRDAINEAAGEPVFETNDVIRLALVGARRYEALLADPTVDVDPDAEPTKPLLEALATAVDADESIPGKEAEESD
jgi:hypothetical protein